MGICYDKYGSEIYRKETTFDNINFKEVGISPPTESLSIEIKPSKAKFKSQVPRYSLIRDYLEAVTSCTKKSKDTFEEFYSNYLKSQNSIEDTRKRIIKDKKALHIVVYGASDSEKASFIYQIDKKGRNDYYIPNLSSEIITSGLAFEDRYYKLIITIPTDIDKPEIFLGDCYFVFFEFSSVDSFFAAEKIISSRLKKYPQQIYLIGSESDRGRAISMEKIERFCQNFGVKFFELSVRNRLGIRELLESVKADVLSKKVKNDSPAEL